jgi:hypothetical protein
MAISEMAEGYRGKDDRYHFHIYNLGIFETAFPSKEQTRDFFLNDQPFSLGWDMPAIAR